MTSRDVQSKRGLHVVGCNPRLRSDGPQRTVNPDVASLEIGEAEPLEFGRRQHVSLVSSKITTTHFPGVAGAARHEGKALNAGDLARCGWRPQPSVQGREPRRGGRRGVGWVRSTCEGGESRWREGALLDDATDAGKEWGLWRH